MLVCVCVCVRVSLSHVLKHLLPNEEDRLICYLSLIDGSALESQTPVLILLHLICVARQQ